MPKITNTKNAFTRYNNKVITLLNGSCAFYFNGHTDQLCWEQEYFKILLTISFDSTCLNSHSLILMMIDLKKIYNSIWFVSINQFENIIETKELIYWIKINVINEKSVKFPLFKYNRFYYFDFEMKNRIVILSKKKKRN